jgi:allene oxide cyclase-like protein
MRLVNRHGRVWLIGLVAAAILAGGAVAATSQPLSVNDASIAKRTIHLREASATPKLTFVDLGAPGLSVGDHVVTTDGVVRPDGTPAGSTEQVCTVVEPKASLFASTFDCAGSFQLDQGQITVQGAFVPNAAESSFAITGGTGAFARARGEVLLATEADDITIDLH